VELESGDLPDEGAATPLPFATGIAAAAAGADGGLGGVRFGEGRALPALLVAAAGACTRLLPTGGTPRDRSSCDLPGDAAAALSLTSLGCTWRTPDAAAVAALAPSNVVVGHH